jgi:hypothetical protein
VPLHIPGHAAIIAERMTVSGNLLYLRPGIVEEQKRRSVEHGG